MRKIGYIAAATAMLMTVGTAAIGQADEPKNGGTLVIGSTQKARHLNPAVQSGIATAVPGTQIFATPLRFNDKWEAQPYLAESWSVADDGKSITLKLRENAKFHDGEPITSEDVAFSLQTVKENHPFKSMFAPVTGVDTPDPLTAVINFDKPHPAAFLAMSSALLPIIPKHVYGDGQDPKSHPANNAPVGSGPFKFVEFKPGEYIILEKNPDYFIEGRPYLDRIIIKNYKDPTSVALAMDTEEINMYPFLAPTKDIARLKKNDKLIVTDKGYEAVGPVNWLAFNTKNEYLKDKRVRQAIAYAMDRDFVINALLAGQSKAATGPIVPGSPFYADNAEKYDVDLDKANALLDDAGFARGDEDMRFKLTIDYIPGSAELQKGVAEYLKSQLKKVGIDVELRASPDFPTWAKRVGGHDFDMSMDIVFNWGDPVIGVHRTYLCDNIKKGVIWSNTQSYCNEEVDKLLNEAGSELDQEKRVALYKEAQEIIVDDAPLVYINVLPYHTAYNKQIGNPPLTIWGAMSPLDEVYIK
ncbi:ABC transporter substrate-binding protein [uncultured Sneathiella sp.]|uniref:ABC transporter substrate-binding protein n=1 Tax=uncultured Sneathiella sp. TaxID=879315 RepID=UPI0030D7691A|tara:strand:+ start:4173 stop:5753 length:1581 start_codon:yes stop_codon:yes gene_type:complete